MAERARVVIKRVYDRPASSDGMRVLVDRLWPRGLTREAAAADLWLKDAAPSTALRKWYGHRPERWGTFRRKYRQELAERRELLRLLKDLRRRSTLTLLFSAQDTARNHAVVLRDLIA